MAFEKAARLELGGEGQNLRTVLGDELTGFVRFGHR